MGAGQAWPLNAAASLRSVGADLSAKKPAHLTHRQWLKYCIRGQTERRPVRSHDALRLLGYSATSKP